MDDWWSEIDDAVLTCLSERGGSGADDIGRRLGMSTQAVMSILGMLAQEGRVYIARAEAVEGVAVLAERGGVARGTAFDRDASTTSPRVDRRDP